MRRSFLLACLINAFLVASSLAGDWYCRLHRQPTVGCAECAHYEATCEAIARPPGPPTCGQRGPCQCEACRKVPCQPPAQSPPPEQPQLQQQPPLMMPAPVTGSFMQAPPTGTVRGPVNQLGVEGAEIRFPEVNLRLPSLRLPTFSRFRQNARMDVDSSRAPFVENPIAPSQAFAMPQQAVAPTQQYVAPQQSYVPAAEPVYAPAAAPVMMAAPQPVAAFPQMAPAPQQFTVPLNVTMAPQPQQEPQPQQTPTLDRDQLRDLIDRLRARMPQPSPQQAPPQVPPENQFAPPTCSSDNLQQEMHDLKQQMQALQQLLEQRPNCALPAYAPPQPSCEAPPHYQAPPAKGYQGAIPSPPSYPTMGAPWPVPVPDLRSSTNNRNTAQPVGYAEPVGQRFSQTPVIREPSGQPALASAGQGGPMVNSHAIREPGSAAIAKAPVANYSRATRPQRVNMKGHPIP